jgi:hypothetical protein
MQMVLHLLKNQIFKFKHKFKLENQGNIRLTKNILIQILMILKTC